MVFLHFPSAHTDEELMLLAKYAILKKKKLAVQAYLNPKAEPEKVNMLKRPREPKDAKEHAKKLILSGKITVPVKATGSKVIFKKPQGLVRKLSETKAAAIVSPMLNPDGGAFQSSSSGITGVSSGIQYKPFTPSHTPSASSDFSTSPYQDRKFSFNPGRRRFSNFAESSSTISSDSETSSGGSSPYHNQRSPAGFSGYPDQNSRPKQGKTIYVRGVGSLTEEICREAFNNIGSIINVTMELDRSCGFVTFDKMEAAERAIQEVNGTYVGGCKLTVSFARRQLPISELVGDGSSTGLLWATIQANPSHKASHKDKRSIVSYEDE